MDEDGIRYLFGYSTVPEVSFCGQQWKIRETGLAPMLRFVRAANRLGPDDSQLGPIHHLLEDVIIDFADFAQAAFDNRVQDDDLDAVVRQLAVYYCVRSYWSGMRLLAYVSVHFEELDGILIMGGGTGLARLTPREACNVALARCLDGATGEEREVFLMDLEYEGKAEAEAMAAVRQMQADQKERAAADG
jgi:hypothetical protein